MTTHRLVLVSLEIDRPGKPLYLWKGMINVQPDQNGKIRLRYQDIEKVTGIQITDGSVIRWY